MNTVFILGAGASVEAGGPVISNFLDKADDLRRRDKTGNLSEVFDDVFKAIADLRGVYEKADINRNNIEDLFSAIDAGSFSFVHALQLAVVAFVQNLGAVCVNVFLSKNGQDNIERVCGALEKRRGSGIDADMLLSELLSGSTRFGATRFG